MDDHNHCDCVCRVLDAVLCDKRLVRRDFETVNFGPIETKKNTSDFREVNFKKKKLASRNYISQVLAGQGQCNETGSKITKITIPICKHKFVHESNCLRALQHSKET